MTEETYKTDLKNKSFTQDLSVIQPGRAPAIPIYGPVSQRVLSQGTNLPEIFYNAVTPTDNSLILAENRSLRNMVLQRRHKCDWCEFTFADHDEAGKRAHFLTHKKQLASGGDACDMCGDTGYRFMSSSEKRAHHIACGKRRETEVIANFWKTCKCPICDEDLSRMDPKIVLQHVASHTPEVIKYCDRCGRDKDSLSVAEKLHHDRICVLNPEAKGRQEYCDRCAQDLTDITPRNRQRHDRICGLKPARNFCTICSLDFASLSIHEARAHRANCKAPAAPPNSFCNRCAKDRLAMDDAQVAQHKRDCFSINPNPHAIRDQIAG